MSPGADKYEFRDLKRDLEGIQAEFSENYPSELVYQKLFDVTFQMSELLAFVNKQISQNAEMFSSARLKQVEADFLELKKELGEERNHARDSRHEQETALIKVQSQNAILQEKLNNAQREVTQRASMSSLGNNNQGGDGQQAGELLEQLKQRDQIIRRLKEEAQEKLSITREEANQVASGDMMVKERECESLKS